MVSMSTVTLGHPMELTFSPAVRSTLLLSWIAPQPLAPIQLLTPRPTWLSAELESAQAVLPPIDSR